MRHQNLQKYKLRKKVTLTDLVQITIQDVGPIEENHTQKQDNATNTIKENDVIKTPYRHPNNKNRYPKS